MKHDRHGNRIGQRPFESSSSTRRSLGLVLIVVACLIAAATGCLLWFLGFRMLDTVATEQELRQKVAEAASTLRAAGYVLVLTGFVGMVGFRSLLAAQSQSCAEPVSRGEVDPRHFPALDGDGDDG